MKSWVWGRVSMFGNNNRHRDFAEEGARLANEKGR